MNRIRKIGSCISGPPWIERTRSATPAAHSVAVMLTRIASVYMPTRSIPEPSICIPATRATAVRTAQVTKARPSAARPEPAMIPRRSVAAAEAGLEIAGDAEAGEDAAEGRRLEQHEDVLEGGVAGREVEAGDVADGGEPAGEGGEEEEREDQRRDQQCFVGEEIVDAAPGDGAGGGPESGLGTVR